MDEDRLQRAVRALLEGLGEDPLRDGLRETPRRVAEFFREFTAGASQDPRQVLSTGFEEGYSGLVAVGGVRFYSLCEHHLLPFFGVAHIGYIPSGFVVGASKLVRALEVLAHRLQVQERLTAQLADALEEALHPQGVGVVLSAEHLCMVMRGVEKPGSRIVTAVARGVLARDPWEWSRFLSLVGAPQGVPLNPQP